MSAVFEVESKEEDSIDEDEDAEEDTVDDDTEIFENTVMDEEDLNNMRYTEYISIIYDARYEEWDKTPTLSVFIKRIYAYMNHLFSGSTDWNLHEYVLSDVIEYVDKMYEKGMCKDFIIVGLHMINSVIKSCDINIFNDLYPFRMLIPKMYILSIHAEIVRLMENLTKVKLHQLYPLIWNILDKFKQVEHAMANQTTLILIYVLGQKLYNKLETIRDLLSINMDGPLRILQIKIRRAYLLRSIHCLFFNRKYYQTDEEQIVIFEKLFEYLNEVKDLHSFRARHYKITISEKIREIIDRNSPTTMSIPINYRYTILLERFNQLLIQLD